jgi:shikimate dehydrogenase
VNPYPTLSGETLVVPIIGDPIAQVRSPDGITRLFAARGRNAVVVPLQAAAADLEALITGLGPSSSVGGLIATVPHKFGLAAQCATLTDRARFLATRTARGTATRSTARRSSRPSARPGACPRGRVPCRSGPGERGPRSRSRCWRPASRSWRCTTPTQRAATRCSDGCRSGSALG